MQTPFSKSISSTEKYQKLLDVAAGGGSLAILINADPDALASALALKRLLWRRVKPISIFRINRIERADNLAMVNLLDIGHRHIRLLKKNEFTLKALVDSQPSHDKRFVAMNIIKKIESSEITRARLPRFQDAMRDLVFVKQMAVVHLGEVNNPDTLVQVTDFFLKMAEATWSIASGVYSGRLVVIIRNAGFRRHAGKFARDAFGNAGVAGGHRDSARAEIPLENIGQGTVNDEDCRRFVFERARKAYGQ